MKQQTFSKLLEDVGFFIAENNVEVTKREVYFLVEYMLCDIVSTMKHNPPKHLCTTFDENQHKATLEHYFKLFDQRYA